MKCSIYTKILGTTNWDVQNIWATYPGKLKTTAFLKFASLLLGMCLGNWLPDVLSYFAANLKAKETNGGGVRNRVLFAVLYGVQYLVSTVGLV